MSVLLLWIAQASAEPSRVAAQWTVSSPSDLAVAASGDTVAILGTGFTLLDLATWSTTALSVCSDGGDPAGLASGTFTDSAGDDHDAFWVGCGDGTVERIDVVDDSPTLASDVIAAADSAITGLEYDGSYLYVIAAGSSGLADVTAVAPKDASVASGYPTTLSYDELNDSVLVSGSLYVLHGNDDVSRLTTSGGGVLISTQATGADYHTITATDADLLFLTDTNGGDIWSFDTGSNGFTLHVSDVGDATTALCFDESAEWAAISADTDLVFYDFAGGAFGDEASRLSDVGSLDRLVATSDGALGISTADSLVDWATAAPWVEITSAPSTASTDPVDVTFSSDASGDWTFALGSTLADAVEIDSGTVDAGGSETVSVTPGDTWVEGANRLWVTVDDGVHIGHDAVDVTVDTPPPQMAIAVGFGESTVSVQVTADDTADLQYFEIYLSDTAFTADDYPDGGPSFDDGNVTGPVEIDATPNTDASYTFYPLANGTTYYVAVRAVDSGGQVGPMSSVLSATPSYTYSASELRGDEGGFSCATASRPGAGTALGLVLSAVVAMRRRRGRAAGQAG